MLDFSEVLDAGLGGDARVAEGKQSIATTGKGKGGKRREEECGLQHAGDSSRGWCINYNFWPCIYICYAMRCAGATGITAGRIR
jgi:hypothetical protein